MKKMRSPLERLSTIPFLGWVLFAVLVRIVAAKTFTHWFHPDEWCQTLEPANIIAHGFGFHSQEIGLHLRNLTWPMILAAVLKITHFLNPSSIDLRITSVNLLCGILDLGILWGWIQVLNRDEFTSKLSPRFKLWSLGLLLLPWFTIYGSISPRGEHLSEIALWVTLGLIAKELWIPAGIACVAIFAFRYPSVLLSAGIGLALLIQAARTRNLLPVWKASAGLVLGGVIFGLADWIVYGRPWESFWMYLQYNLFTGSSSLVFGKQGIFAYSEFFLWNWATHKLLLPLGIFLLVCTVYGTWKSLLRFQPWALCLIVYIIGHLLVPHKEGRFMLPVDTLTRWAAFVGAILIIDKGLRSKMLRSMSSETAARGAQLALGALGLFTIVNGLIFLHTLRADLWKYPGTYREIEIHLAESPPVCGVLTRIEMTSLLTPFKDSMHFPFPALGSFANPAGRFQYDDLRTSSVMWREYAPQCQKGDHLLLHLNRAEKNWEKEGCSLLTSGVLRTLPKFAREWALNRDLLHGAWYLCPHTLLGSFQSQVIAQLFSHKFGYLKKLPALGITAEGLEKLGHETSPPPKDIHLPSVETKRREASIH